jgi:DNA-binding SARP family transcriptional activator
MSDIQFRVLGPVELRRDGKPVPLGGNTTLALLGGLLTSPNRIVPVSTIVEWLWGGKLPDHPRDALHNGVSRLRRLLGAGFLSTHAGGYCLHAHAGNLDLLRFEQLRTSARDAISRGAAMDAMKALDEAVWLWQEPLLSNVESPALRGEVVPQLTERYLAAVEERAGLYIRSGRPDAIAHDLSAVVARHPFRERLVGQLMVALTRSGRRADAIGAYVALRRMLREELGIDPGVEVQNLLVKILREDSGALPGRRPSADVVSDRQ